MPTDELQLVLGRNVRALRERAGLSQEAFGDRVGLHRTYVGGVERGERNLTLQTVARIGSELGVQPVALLIDWDVALPVDPRRPAEPERPHLRAASDGDDPGRGGRAVAERTGRPRPRRS